MNFGGITCLVIDQGLDFCKLHVDIVIHACSIGEKNGIYIILKGNSIDVSGYCYTRGCYTKLFANCSLNIRIIKTSIFIPFVHTANEMMRKYFYFSDQTKVI